MRLHVFHYCAFIIGANSAKRCLGHMLAKESPHPPVCLRNPIRAVITRVRNHWLNYRVETTMVFHIQCRHYCNILKIFFVYSKSN